jgi:hypothetical protein
VNVRKQTARDRAKRYHDRRKALIEKLGGKCADCGSTTQLELDGINGHRKQPNKLARWNRVKMYEDDFAAGNLACRCRTCNASRGRRSA